MILAWTLPYIQPPLLCQPQHRILAREHRNFENRQDFVHHSTATPLMRIAGSGAARGTKAGASGSRRSEAPRRCLAANPGPTGEWRLVPSDGSQKPALMRSWAGAAAFAEPETELAPRNIRESRLQMPTSEIGNGPDEKNGVRPRPAPFMSA